MYTLLLGTVNGTNIKKLDKWVLDEHIYLSVMSLWNTIWNLFGYTWHDAPSLSFSFIILMSARCCIQSLYPRSNSMQSSANLWVRYWPQNLALWKVVLYSSYCPHYFFPPRSIIGAILEYVDGKPLVFVCLNTCFTVWLS